MAKAKKTENKKNSSWIWILVILVMFSVLSMIIAGILSLFLIPSSGFQQVGNGNVAIISVKGPIVLDGSSDIFSGSVAASNTIISLIKEAEENDKIKAIVLDINSPGGSPVPSDEIAAAIKESNKTTVALIREVGASGAYWIASAADKVYANRMSITGSIGAYSGYLEFSEFIDDYNITYNLIKSGKYKAIGSPLKELTPEERYQLQLRVNKIHDFFIEGVAENRNMSIEEVEKLADGLWYLGSESKDLGLVDELGSKEDVRKYLEEELGEKVNFVRYEYKGSIFDSIFALSSEGYYNIGKGIGDSMKLEEKEVFEVNI
jgi:protease-4